MVVGKVRILQKIASLVITSMAFNLISLVVATDLKGCSLLTLWTSQRCCVLVTTIHCEVPIELTANVEERVTV